MGFRVEGFRALGFRALGFRALGFRVEGVGCYADCGTSFISALLESWLFGLSTAAPLRCQALMIDLDEEAEIWGEGVGEG